VKVEVDYTCGDSTTKVDAFECESAGSQILQGGHALIIFVDGSDSKGPVTMVQYGRVNRILRRL
jgi:hypothetical protein